MFVFLSCFFLNFLKGIEDENILDLNILMHWNNYHNINRFTRKLLFLTNFGIFAIVTNQGCYVKLFSFRATSLA